MTISHVALFLRNSTKTNPLAKNLIKRYIFQVLLREYPLDIFCGGLGRFCVGFIPPEKFLVLTLGQGFGLTNKHLSPRIFTFKHKYFI